MLGHVKIGFSVYVQRLTDAHACSPRRYGLPYCDAMIHVVTAPLVDPQHEPKAGIGLVWDSPSAPSQSRSKVVAAMATEARHSEEILLPMPPEVAEALQWARKFDANSPACMASLRAMALWLGDIAAAAHLSDRLKKQYHATISNHGLMVIMSSVWDVVTAAVRPKLDALAEEAKLANKAAELEATMGQTAFERAGIKKRKGTSRQDAALPELSAQFNFEKVSPGSGNLTPAFSYPAQSQHKHWPPQPLGAVPL